jgi:hypothetical protein
MNRTALQQQCQRWHNGDDGSSGGSAGNAASKQYESHNRNRWQRQEQQEVDDTQQARRELIGRRWVKKPNAYTIGFFAMSENL